MARKKEACEYCSEERFESIGEAHQLSVEWYPFNGYIDISSFSSSEENEGELQYTIPLNYCPVCGRKLM